MVVSSESWWNLINLKITLASILLLAGIAAGFVIVRSQNSDVENIVFELGELGEHVAENVYEISLTIHNRNQAAIRLIGLPVS